MPPVVTAGAMLACSFGVAPASLIVTAPRPLAENRPMAAITDTTPANIPTFGMCMSLANPQVAGATAAALGVLTPMPCVPVIPAPWAPGAATSLLGGMPALTLGAVCTCVYAGAITIIGPPAATVQAT